MSNLRFPSIVLDQLKTELQALAIPLTELTKTRADYKGDKMAFVRPFVMTADLMNNHPILSTRDQPANIITMVQGIREKFNGARYAYERMYQHVTEFSNAHAANDPRFKAVNLSQFIGSSTIERRRYEDSIWRLKKIGRLLTEIELDAEEVETVWSSMILLDFNTDQERIKHAADNCYRSGMAIVQPAGTGASEVLDREDIEEIRAAGIELISMDEYTKRAKVHNDVTANIVGRMLDGMNEQYKLAWAVIHSLEQIK